MRKKLGITLTRQVVRNTFKSHTQIHTLLPNVSNTKCASRSKFPTDDQLYTSAVPAFTYQNRGEGERDGALSYQDPTVYLLGNSLQFNSTTAHLFFPRGNWAFWVLRNMVMDNFVGLSGTAWDNEF